MDPAAIGNTLLTLCGGGAIGALAHKILDRRTAHEQLAWDRVTKLESLLEAMQHQLDRTQDQLRESQSKETQLLTRIELLERDKANLRDGYRRRGREIDLLRMQLDALTKQVGPPITEGT